MSKITKLSRDNERKATHEKTGSCAYAALVELVDGLYDYQKAAEDAGWTGPHKDKYGATFYQDETDDSTWACFTWKQLCEANDIEPERSESGERAIHEDPLSVLVREDWHEPGKKGEIREYEILLSTGGPATRIVGRLSEYNEPETARLEVQDWFVPWTEWRGDELNEEVLLTYARCFYFGD